MLANAYSSIETFSLKSWTYMSIFPQRRCLHDTMHFSSSSSMDGKSRINSKFPHSKDWTGEFTFSLTSFSDWVQSSQSVLIARNAIIRYINSLITDSQWFSFRFPVLFYVLLIFVVNVSPPSHSPVWMNHVEALCALCKTYSFIFHSYRYICLWKAISKTIFEFSKTKSFGCDRFIIGYKCMHTQYMFMFMRSNKTIHHSPSTIYQLTIPTHTYTWNIFEWHTKKFIFDSFLVIRLLE